MNELQIQAELVKAVKALGGHAFKSNNAYLAGVPDLFIALPKIGNAYAEVKFLRTPGAMVVDVTALQALTISKLRAAGAGAGLIAVRHMGQAGRYDCLVTRCPAPGDRVNSPHYSTFSKLVGGQWPIESIITAIKGDLP